MRRMLVGIALAFGSIAAIAGPPTPPAQNVNVVNTPSVNVANSVLPVEISNANPVMVSNAQPTQPYFSWAGFTYFNCGANCSNWYAYESIEMGKHAMFDLPAVPAGKRLVITNIGGMVPAATTANVVALKATRALPPAEDMQTMYAGPFFQVKDGYTFSGSVFASYGPGQKPIVLLTASGGWNNSSTLTQLGFITVSGYLVDAN